MADLKAYSVRVELLRAGETSYARLTRDMYKKGFRHLFKDKSGSWVRLPKGTFAISTAEPMDLVKRTATHLANSIDPTAMVKMTPMLSWGN